MAQRHEIEAWVNPAAWDDEAEGWRVVEAIESSGTDDEADWTRIAHGTEEAIGSAANRARERAWAAVADALVDYRVAEEQMAQAREDLYEALRQAMRDGHTAYRLAQVTGLSQAMIGRIRRHP